MLSAYSIRKLIEAKKLSDSTVQRVLKVNVYPSRGKPITLLNWHHLEHLYNLESRSSGVLDLIAFCNQIIHSYVFIPHLDDEDHLHSIYVTSDRMREKQLFEIPIKPLADLLEVIGNDYPSGSTIIFNPKRRDYDVVNCNPTPLSSPKKPEQVVSQS